MYIVTLSSKMYEKTPREYLASKDFSKAGKREEGGNVEGSIAE